MVLRLVIFTPRRPNFSLSTSKANLIERSTFLPQSLSGLACECACLKAKRFGVAALKAARWPSEIGAVKFALSPAGGRIGALAADQIDRVVLQVVRAGTGPLVGIGDGAAVL